MLMNANHIGNQLIKLNIVDSTNNYAAKYLKQTKIPFGTVIMAQYQTKGKGQVDSVWNANKNDNILMSVILDTSFLSVNRVFYLSKIVSLSIHESLNSFDIGNIFIKWPNDIFVNKEKIAGILIENQWKGQSLISSIVGIGINVNQTLFPESYNATSLKLLKSKTYSLDEVFEKVIARMNYNFTLLNNLSFDKIDSDYHKYLLNYNKITNFFIKNKIVKAKLCGVDSFGKIVLKMDNNELKYYDLKQVKQIM